MKPTFLEQQNALARKHLRDVALHKGAIPLVELTWMSLADGEGGFEVSSGPYAPDNEDWNYWMALCMDCPEELLEPLLRVMKKYENPVPVDAADLPEWAEMMIVLTLEQRYYGDA